MCFVLATCNGEKLRLVDLDGRVDCIRDVNSITLRVRIVFNLRNGRKFLSVRIIQSVGVNIADHPHGFFIPCFPWSGRGERPSVGEKSSV